MTHDQKGPVTRLREQFDEKSKSCKELQDEYLRALADFDNLRRRTERDSEVSRRLMLEALVLDLVPVLDNFDRAIQTAEAGANADGIRKGMELIRRQLCDALSRHGVEEFSCAGAHFDPRRAEAISYVHTDEHKPGTVMREVCKGFACGERVLRPAKVVVAKEPQGIQNPESRIQNSEGADKAAGRSQESEAGVGSAEVADGEESEDVKAEAGESGSASNG